MEWDSCAARVTKQANVSTLQTDVVALQAGDASVLAGIFAGVSRFTADHDNDPITPEIPTIRFEGVNLQIVNGLGETDGVPGIGAGIVNGVGNLIIGYDEPIFPFLFGGLPSSIKTGSHNLVVGSGHNYSSFGGLVVGLNNRISAAYSSVSGGTRNTASGGLSSVSGGFGNTADGSWSSVGGGANLTASFNNQFLP